jgi:hypothetical protein
MCFVVNVMHASRFVLLVTVFLLAACGSGDSPCASGFSCAGDAQTPATGKLSDIDAWIARGDYKQWKCEADPHDARPKSPHSKNRICSNTKLSENATDNYPVGAATVKELYQGSDITGYAIMLKIKAGTGGDSWYWFERLGGSTPANGPDDSTCTGCHASGKDYIFTQVK